MTSQPCGKRDNCVYSDNFQSVAWDGAEPADPASPYGAMSSCSYTINPVVVLTAECPRAGLPFR